MSAEKCKRSVQTEAERRLILVYFSISELACMNTRITWVSGRSSVMQYHCITFWDYLRSGRVSPRLTVSLFGSASLMLRNFFFWSPHLFLLSSSVLRRCEDERNSDEKSARISRSGMCGLPVNNWPVDLWDLYLQYVLSWVIEMLCIIQICSSLIMGKFWPYISKVNSTVG